MSINKSSVKQYQMIRRYLSLIYLYGFFSREDFQDLLPDSSASYDACISLIKDIYPEMREGRYCDSRKYLTIKREGQRGDVDRLCNTFFLSSLTEEELINVFELFQMLAVSQMNINQFCGCFDEFGSSGSTVRRRMNDLIEFGYLRREQKKQIAIKENRLSLLTDEELDHLYRYVLFCGNITYPRVPARFLLRSIEREYLRRGINLPSRQLFQFLRSPNHDVMEEDLVCTLLQAIREKREVVMKLGRGADKISRAILPFRLRIDRRLGRWYLLSMEEQPTIRRLSRIQSLELGKQVDPERWKSLRQQVDAAFQYSRFSGHMPEDGPSTVRVKLRFGDMKGLRRQFARELRGGEILQEGEEEILTEKINDPVELIPLLRSYSPWLEPIEKDSPAMSRIRADLLSFRAQLTEEAEL